MNSVLTRNSALSVNRLLENIPKNLLEQTSIEIQLFSSVCCEINPCQQIFLSTSVFFETGYSCSHHIYFEGYENTCGLRMYNQLFIPVGLEELSVKIVNYSQTIQTICVGMPLGRLLISPNI